MRWTDEVHSERTLEARREAKLFSRGQEISAKGRTKLDLLVLTTGVFAALAQCESRGKLRVVRLPFIGPWASKKLLLLRRRLADPLGKRSSGANARESVRSAALRRQGQAQGQTASSHQAQQQSKKKNKGRRKR